MNVKEMVRSQGCFIPIRKMHASFDYDKALEVAKQYLPEDKAIEFATWLKAARGQMANAIQVGGKDLTKLVIEQAFSLERADD